jgi:hypothetical protein
MFEQWSVYDLAFHFVQDFYGKECPKDVKSEVLDYMHDLLWDGFTTKEIVSRWKQFKMGNPGKVPDLDQLYKEAPTELNLLKPGKFYYHNKLILLPPPPKREFDINTGEIKKIEEPYFLEMRASMTIGEVTQYYIEQFGLRRVNEVERNHIEGTIKVLLRHYDVELILFMIDCAANERYSEDDGPPTDPITLKSYSVKAEEARQAKITEIRENGEERIVTRKRVLC